MGMQPGQVVVVRSVRPNQGFATEGVACVVVEILGDRANVTPIDISGNGYEGELVPLDCLVAENAPEWLEAGRLFVERASAPTLVIEVEIDDRHRFAVSVNYGQGVINLYTRTLCPCSDPSASLRQRDRYGALDGKPCWSCRGKSWRSSPDEGTSIPITRLDALMTALSSIKG